MCSVCLCALCSTGSCVDSWAWLITFPDRTPPAAALTELAVHWGCVNVCPQTGPMAVLTLPGPSGHEVAASVVQLHCFSLPKLYQGLGKGALPPLCPCLGLGMTLSPAAEAAPRRLSRDSLPFQQLQIVAQVCISVWVAACSPSQMTWVWDAEVGEKGGGESKRDPSSYEVWDPSQCRSAWTPNYYTAWWICPPLFLLGETVPPRCWLRYCQTVFHSAATSHGLFKTHRWLTHQTPSPFPLNLSHRTWHPSLRNGESVDSPVFQTRVRTHVHTHTTVGDRVWIPLLQTWSLLRLVSVSWCK